MAGDAITSPIATSATDMVLAVYDRHIIDFQDEGSKLYAITYFL